MHARSPVGRCAHAQFRVHTDACTSRALSTCISSFTPYRTFADSVPEPFGTQCGTYIIERSWTVQHLDAAGIPVGTAITQVQTITVTDYSTPVFQDATDAVVTVPFFSSRRETGYAIPTVHKTSTAFFRSQGLNYPLTLASEDSDFILEPGTADASSQCEARGLASFTRLWTAKDACDNFVDFTQKITILHPPTSQDATTAMQTLLPQEYAIAIDVVPNMLPCMPAKNVTISSKVYEALAPHDQCPTHNWKDDGCRVISRGTMTVHAVTAVKPVFDNFPDDAEITTADSHLPASTGQPAVYAHCGTPWRRFYTDAPPEPTTSADAFCGWTIRRTWTVVPLYTDCAVGVLESSPLSTSRVQRLLVSDDTAPYFITSPSQVCKHIIIRASTPNSLERGLQAYHSRQHTELVRKIQC